MENQLVTSIVILDLSAAIDTVDHNLLLEVLGKRFGVGGTALDWYKSYLEPRRFRVAIKDKTSKYHRVVYKEHFSS